MTAFSRQQADGEWGSLIWEIRSVNHRYLETSIRLPEAFRGLENSFREKLRMSLNRGKVECQLHFKSPESNGSKLKLNKDLIMLLLQANSEISESIGHKSKISAIDILRWPGVIGDHKLDTEVLDNEARELFDQALDALISARKREGGVLKNLLLKRIGSIQKIINSIRAKMPEIIANQKKNLLDRLKELKAELEPTRLEQEIAMLAQKADIDEELDRLDSHLQEVERIISSSGQKGRRLDFLMQELNREANTLSSKSIAVESTLGAVELKVLIEQMREQIQNIE